METRARSIVKALTWRATALLITAGVVWLVTGEAKLAGEIALLDTLIKLGVYYAHERCWLKVRFGRPKAPEYQI